MGGKPEFEAQLWRKGGDAGQLLRSVCERDTVKF